MFIDSYESMLERHGVTLIDKLKQFIERKKDNPMNSFGSRDKPFTGHMRDAVPGEVMMHVHLLHDANLLYTLTGADTKVIKLYGIFTHDDIGTGQPQKDNIQRNYAAKLASQKNQFSDLNPRILIPKTKEPEQTEPNVEMSLQILSDEDANTALAAYLSGMVAEEIAPYFGVSVQQLYEEFLRLANNNQNILNSWHKQHQKYANK
jgi:hypothetical protein